MAKGSPIQRGISASAKLARVATPKGISTLARALSARKVGKMTGSMTTPRGFTQRMQNANPKSLAKRTASAARSVAAFTGRTTARRGTTASAYGTTKRK